MKIFLFLCGFSVSLGFQWLVFRGMIKEASLASQENIQHMLSPNGIQQRIGNFIQSYLLAVVCGIATVYVLHS
jgi:hypothetical protein